MSSTDRRVIEMVFDNAAFERGVAKTLDTLKNLNEALNLTGAVKGFTLDPVVKSVNAVAGKFSALEVAAITALQNITNKAIDAGERLLKSISIDQISEGFSKYEQKTQAVQTIIAATGAEIDTVNTQLERLNWFTDETSYNFVDMVNSIGKFTSSGVLLEDAVTAMQGISTWAALSGGGINEASRAMYNLSQAMSVGVVKIQDWNSIESANMSTIAFKETVLETAVAAGTLRKEIDGTYATIEKGTEVTAENFRSALNEGWFTSDVLMKSLDKYGSAATKIAEMSDKTGLSATRILQALSDFSEKGASYVISKYADELDGATENQLVEYLTELSDKQYELGVKAFRAAQEAKTFTEAIGSVKDAVSTGWMTSFEVIFGDYEKAKVLWTDLANELYDTFAESGNARNEILKEWASAEKGGRDDLISGISTSWSSIRSVIDSVKRSFTDVFGKASATKLAKFVEKFKDFSEMIEPSDAALRKIHDSFQALFHILKEFTTTLSILWDSLSPIMDAVPGFIDAVLEGMKKLDNGGVLQLNISIARLSKTISKLIYYFSLVKDEFIKVFDEFTGGKNIFNEVAAYFASLVDIFAETFDHFYISDEAVEGLGKGFEGLLTLFAVAGKVFKIFFKVLSRTIDKMGGPTIDTIADLAEYFGGLVDSLDTDEFYNTVEGLLTFIIDTVSAIKEAFDEVFGSKIAEDIGSVIPYIIEFIKSFRLGEDTIPNLENIFKGFFTVLDWGYEILKSIIELVSPIWEKYLAPLVDKILSFGAGIGEFIFENKESVDKFAKSLKDDFGPKIVAFFDNIAGAITRFIPSSEDAKKALDTIGEYASKLKEKTAYIWMPIKQGLADAKKNIEEFFGIDPSASFSENIVNVFETMKMRITTFIEDIKEAISIIKGESSEDPSNARVGFFVNLMNFLMDVVDNIKWLFDQIGKIISDYIKDNQEFVDEHGGVVGTAIYWLQELIKVMILMKTSGAIDAWMGLTWAIEEGIERIMTGGLMGFDLGAKNLFLIGLTLYLFAKSLVSIAELDIESITKSIVSIIILMGVIAIAYEELATVATMHLGAELATDAAKAKPTKAGIGGLFGLGISLFLLAESLKIISKLDINAITNGILGLAGMLVMLGVFFKIAGENLKYFNAGTGGGLFLMSIGILVLTGVVAILGALEWTKVQRGLLAIGEILLSFSLFALLMKQADWKSLLAAGAAFTLMAAGLIAVVTAVAVLVGIMAIGGGKDGALGIAVAITALAVAIIVIAVALESIANVKTVRLLAAAIAFTVVSAALLIIASSIALLTAMDMSKMDTAVLGIVAVVGTLVIAMLALDGLSEDAGFGGAKSLIVCAVAVLVMAKALARLEKVDALNAVLKLAAVLVVLYIATRQFESVIDVAYKLSKTLLILSAALFVLGLALIALGGGIVTFVGSLTIGAKTTQLISKTLNTFLRKMIGGLLEWILDELIKATDKLVILLGVLIEDLIALVISAGPMLMYALAVIIVDLFIMLDAITYPVAALIVSILVKICLALIDMINPVVATLVLLIVKVINALAIAIAELGGPVATAMYNLVSALWILFLKLLGTLLAFIPGVQEGINKFTDDWIQDLEEPDFSPYEKQITAAASNSIEAAFGKIDVDNATYEKATSTIFGQFADVFKNQTLDEHAMDSLKDQFEEYSVRDKYYSEENISPAMDIMPGWTGDTSDFADLEQDGYDTGAILGEDVSEGYIDSIISYYADSYDTGYGMVDQTEQGARDAGDMHSPSRLFAKLGGYVTTGFVKGIEEYGNRAREAGEGLVEDSVEGVSNAINTISDVISEDLDNNTFTITPVVDMSQANRTISGSLNGITTPINASIDGDINRRFDEYSLHAQETKAQTAAIIAEMRNMKSDFANMMQNIANIQMVLDTGALVGSMVIPMDAALGRRAQFKGRRN